MTVSPKPCLNLCSYKCLSCSLRRAKFYTKGIIDRKKGIFLSSSYNHLFENINWFSIPKFGVNVVQRSSPSRISDTPLAEFKLAKILSSRFVEWTAVVITTTHSATSDLLTKLFIQNSFFINYTVNHFCLRVILHSYITKNT